MINLFSLPKGRNRIRFTLTAATPFYGELAQGIRKGYKIGYALCNNLRYKVYVSRIFASHNGKQGELKILLHYHHNDKVVKIGTSDGKKVQDQVMTTILTKQCGYVEWANLLSRQFGVSQVKNLDGKMVILNTKNSKYDPFALRQYCVFENLVLASGLRRMANLGKAVVQGIEGQPFKIDAVYLERLGFILEAPKTETKSKVKAINND